MADEFWDRFDDIQKARLTNDDKTGLIDMFRVQIFDFDATLNILNGKKLEFTDAAVKMFLDRAIRDINKGSPPTKYTIFDFPADQDGLLISGAAMFSLMADGILQLRNQYQAQDSGLTMGMFQKSGQYQQWAAFLLQPYFEDRAEFKRGIIMRSAGSGFVGIGSEFGYRNGGY